MSQLFEKGADGGFLICPLHGEAPHSTAKHLLARRRMEYELVDSDLRLVLLPQDKVGEFAARLPGATKTTPGNLRALLAPEAQNSTARLG